ncbi:restriction endonuclease [Variovorax sp. OV329]|uniref:restriction endonuclease n=1 Tax=Variovorax sp. OV329 TaxID=1882825 RepID=UPI00158760BE|nr:restriction endonuclease [Variovorax sp. OV329]
MKGWLVALVGVLVLLASYQLPKESLFETLSVALRPVAWLALGLGLAFVAYKWLTRGSGGRQVERDVDPVDDDAQAGMTRPSVLAALGVGWGAAPAELEPRFVDTIAVHPHPPVVEDSEPLNEDDEAPAKQWSPRVLARIDWRHFEALCAAFFKQAGFSTSTQSQGSDGGVDIWVQSRHMPEPRIVRCRHWESQSVTVKELRDFLAVMSAQGLAHGTYVTSSVFAPEAVEFAKANGIQTQDGAALLKLISHRSRAQQDELLAIATGAAPATAAPEASAAG